jgi:hypothetical protein
MVQSFERAPDALHNRRRREFAPDDGAGIKVVVSGPFAQRIKVNVAP